jgi:hypothetical protein
MNAKRRTRGSSSPAERHRAYRERPDTASHSVSEESRAKLQEVQDQLGELQQSLSLATVQDDMEEIHSALTLLPAEIENLRNRGYAFRSFLERKVEVLADQWEDASRQIAREVPRLTRELQREADEAERALHRAMAGGTVEISRAASVVEGLEHRVDGARSTVRAMYETLQKNVNQTQSQVEQITWLLDQLDQASFQLHPAEDPVAACKAQFMETKKEGPEGVLYLTDERLIFEQKEKKATKKVLFIATEKETVQELIFSVPIGQIERIESRQKGFLGRKEMMGVLFTPEAVLDEALLRLRGADNEDWAQLIGRVKSGEIAKERSRPKDEAVLEELQDVPTKCPTCGATISVEIVRGMREITCEYCGSVIRL